MISVRESIFFSIREIESIGKNDDKSAKKFDKFTFITASASQAYHFGVSQNKLVSAGAYFKTISLFFGP